MSSISKKIEELLNIETAAAPDVTKPLKTIGEGNMLKGVKNIFNYALIEGEKKGFVKGERRGVVKGSVITISISGVLYFIPKGVRYVRKKMIERKVHDEMGEKIYTVLNKGLMRRVDREDMVGSEAKYNE
ncbi:MAG: hypothetical protein IJB84_01015 [Lachnospiraceae bacterium]|nr:hypothetical protein [Lachnospiraceae bacterium]